MPVAVLESGKDQAKEMMELVIGYAFMCGAIVSLYVAALAAFRGL